jgi:hypothetical protein
MHQRLQRCFIGGCNPRYAAFVAAHPGWRGRVNVLAHSLGSVIVLDMLSRAGTLFQGVRRTAIDPTVDHAMHHATHHATHQVCYPVLAFEVHCFFAMGSPAACFMLSRRADVERAAPAAPPLTIACRTFYNIVNAADPVSYLCAPLVHAVPPAPAWQVGATSAVPPALLLSGTAPAGNGGGAGGGTRREPRYYLPSAKGLAPGGGLSAVVQLIRSACLVDAW